MKPIRLACLACLAGQPLAAQEVRSLDAHVHGVSTLTLAVEGGTLEIGLTSPGMDIVGFEYAASTDADRAAVDAALQTLRTPDTIVTLPEAAECRLTEALADLHAGDDDHGNHDSGDHDSHGHGDHHAEADHHDHDHDHDHAEGDHHADHHAQEARHSAFQARYVYACGNPDALTDIAFPFFGQFANAQDIAVQYATPTATGAAGVARDAAVLTLD